MPTLLANLPHRVTGPALAQTRVGSAPLANLPRRSMARCETPVLVINLDRSHERLARIQAQLEELNIPFHRITGTDGLDLPATQCDHYYSETLNQRSYHRPLAPGEIGCYLSHLRAWQWLLDSGHEHAVILEDDVVLGMNFRVALEMLPQVPKPWDIVKLGSWSHKPVLDTVRCGRFSLQRYGKTPISAFAQAVSRSGAEKLLRARVPFARPVDVDLQYVWETGIEVRGLEPYPVQVCHGEASDIWPNARRPKRRASRLAMLMQRLDFATRQGRHNIGQHGIWRVLQARCGHPAATA